MKRISLLFALVLCLGAAAQNLALHSIGHGIVNSRTGNLAEAHVNLINNGNATHSYTAKRSKVGNTGLVDSNYFCWDLCYPTWVNQSQGTVDIAPGAVAYDFSGYAYVLDTTANGSDTIWYTFENVADSTDFLTVPVLFFFSTTMGQDERTAQPAKIYPNPSYTGRVIVEFDPSPIAGSIDVLDVLGRVHARLRVAPFQSSATWISVQAPKGLYLLRRNLGQNPEILGRVLVQ